MFPKIEKARNLAIRCHIYFVSLESKTRALCDNSFSFQPNNSKLRTQPAIDVCGFVKSNGMMFPPKIFTTRMKTQRNKKKGNKNARNTSIIAKLKLKNKINLMAAQIKFDNFFPSRDFPLRDRARKSYL